MVASYTIKIDVPADIEPEDCKRLLINQLHIWIGRIDAGTPTPTVLDGDDRSGLAEGVLSSSFGYSLEGWDEHN